MTGQEVEVLDTMPAAAVAVEPYRPQLMMTPEDAKALAEGLRENTRAILIVGDDYGVIPGTGSKPSLLKPGAEKLLQWFGLGHRMEVVEVERDDKGLKYGVTYRCVITKALGTAEVVVATCDAYAGRDESKWKNAPWNTIIKMAEKRALVGAALQSTGSSSLFTQDIEPHEVEEPPNPFIVAAVAAVRERWSPDVKQYMIEAGISSDPAKWSPPELVTLLLALGGPRFTPPPSPGDPPAAGDVGAGEAAPAHPVAAPAPATPMTDPQRRKLMVLCSERGLGEKQARLDWAGDTLGRFVESFSTLTKAEAGALIEAAEAAPLAPTLELQS